MDNYCIHKHAKVRSWLAQQPRFHVHYKPTYTSWLNQVETWPGIITHRAIRRGSFSSVKVLFAKIQQCAGDYNKTKATFNWSATAASILEKLQRLCPQISGTGHQRIFMDSTTFSQRTPARRRVFYQEVLIRAS